ncbi:MAG: DM13 domain-containing protein [Cyanobacteria bacterium J06638_22]
MKSFFTLGLLAVLTIGCATNPTEPPAPETDPQTESSAPTTELESGTETEAGMSTPEEAPAEVAQAETAVLRTGMFVDGEHPTQGSVQIVEQDGERVLEFGEDFQTDAGPDLVVVLHRSADVIGESTPPAFPINEEDYVVLEPLQGVAGTQQYMIPADINLEDYQSAAIWCREFNATFGSASLES